MDSSDFQQQQYHHHFQDLHHHHHQMNRNNNTNNSNGGGLTRFRSAPSSYLSNLMATDSLLPNSINSGGTGTVTVTGDDFFNQQQYQQQHMNLHQPRPLSPETENIISRFIHSFSETNKLADIPEMSASAAVKADEQSVPQLQNSNGYNNNNNNQTSISYPQSHPPSSNKPPLSGGGSSKLFSEKIGKSNPSSTLTRHRSSPAGLFDDIYIDNGYVLVSSSSSRGGRGTGRGGGSTSTGGSYGVGNSTTATNINKNRVNEDHSSSSNLRPPPTPSGSTWLDDDDDDDFTIHDHLLSASEINIPAEPELPQPHQNHQNVQVPKEEIKLERPAGGLLAHHLSLPQASMEKLLQFQDSVPCKIRAKRGCATHPRSIAERVRRTRISERMRKLQDLVPNMDKQTNTADMLDLAVEYIKDLQTQVQTMTNKRARCVCPKC